MARTTDNQFYTDTTGQADWGTDIAANFGIMERGYHATLQVGAAVSTGQILTQNSGGYLFPMNTLSLDNEPFAMTFTAQNSGDSTQVLLKGIVRSLGINSGCVPGLPVYVAALTPGLAVSSYSGSDRPCGVGLPGYGVYFNPKPIRPVQYTTSAAIAAVTGSLHLFTVDIGKYGSNRTLKMVGNSANLVELKFWSESTRATSLWGTTSGGVTVVGSAYFRSPFAYENTDTNSYNGTIYGSLKIMSAAAVGSDTISIQALWDRTR